MHRRVGAGRQLVALFTSGAILCAGCASLRYQASYSSAVRHEVLPLRATVTVVLDPALRESWDEDRRPQLEAVRQGFQEALQQDLRANGPVTPSSDQPEARLVVTLREAKATELKLYWMIWFLAPLWLLGVPVWKGSVELGAELQLTSLKGDPLYRLAERAGCSQHQGVYYGHEDLSFGCPARKLAEAFRDRLSLNRSEILGLLARSAPPPVPAAPPRALLEERPASASIAVVFQIRDVTGLFGAPLMEQLTEILSTQLVAQLGLRVTSAEQLRGQLTEVKVASYKECFDRACQIELGKALAANKAVAASLLRFGQSCSLSVTILDIRSEATERAASVKLPCLEAELPDGVLRVVQALQKPAASGAP
ncbi:MAG TPA: hypothetical protein PK668_03285 [Myxococcota bacterium]|nr:hypothetical protein [Myxococcota bacterium]HRY91878.1 hypothetical protein [Myxococcota bacterium]HSA22221.1 hypothetical protein [Myxococcota bacterium]